MRKTRHHKLPSLTELHRLLNYNPETGEFRWKIRRSNILPNSVAGTVDSDGYRIIRINKLNYLAHRLAWYMYHEVDPGDYLVDHIKGVKTGGDAIVNLRLADDTLNAQNKEINRNGKLVGATFRHSRNKWEANITYEGKDFYLGQFNTEQEAHNHYMLNYERVINGQPLHVIKHHAGLPGATFVKSNSKWRAQIQQSKCKRHIGLFDTEQEAHEAYLNEKGKR